jgi:hypothetical protein
MKEGDSMSDEITGQIVEPPKEREWIIAMIDYSSSGDGSYWAPGGSFSTMKDARESVENNTFSKKAVYVRVMLPCSQGVRP